MMVKSNVRRSTKLRANNPVIRFAHPFFTDEKPVMRAAVANVAGAAVAQRMTDVIKKHLEKIPPVKGDSTMQLSDVIGDPAVAAIVKEKSIVFHTAGDTGHANGLAQEYVSEA